MLPFEVKLDGEKGCLLESIQLRGGGKVQRNPRGRVQVVGHRLVADDDDGIDQVFLAPTCGEECLDQGWIDVAAALRDALDQAGERVELGVEAGVAVADFE